MTPHGLVFGFLARRPELPLKESTHWGDTDYRSVDFSIKGVLEEWVRKKIKRIECSIHQILNWISMAQDKQNKKYRCRGNAFPVGDYIRLKLSGAERHQRGGQKYDHLPVL